MLTRVVCKEISLAYLFFGYANSKGVVYPFFFPLFTSGRKKRSFSPLRTPYTSLSFPEDMQEISLNFLNCLRSNHMILAYTKARKEELKSYLLDYLAYKGIKVFRNNMMHCFVGKHKDRTPSMHYFVGDDGKPRLTCHTQGCVGTIDIYDAIFYLDHIAGHRNQYDFLNNWVGNFLPTNTVSISKREIPHEKKQNRLSNSQRKSFLHQCNQIQGYKYWYSRGIEKEVIHAYHLTYHETQNALVIPIDNYGFILRYLTPIDSQSPKYKRSLGLSECLHTHNMDPNLPILITEGEIDALSLIQVGYPNVWAIGGVQKLDKWLKKIYKINAKIILALDRDKAGIDAKAAAYNYCDIENWERPLDFWDFFRLSNTIKIKDVNDLLVTYPSKLKEAIQVIKNTYGGSYEKNK